MGTELTKQPASNGQIETYKRLYSAAWEKGFSELMFLMAEQYGVELLIQIEGTDRKVPSPTVKFWRESLKDLSPNEMREALRIYMGGERGNFKPNPEELKHCIPDGAGKDKPRVVVNPDCPYCCGTSWKNGKGKLHVDVTCEDRLRDGVTRCQCPKVVYAGQEYPWASAQKKLPAAPIDAEEANQLATADLAKLSENPEVKAVLQKAKRGMAWPQEREMSDADYRQRESELAEQKEKLLNATRKEPARETKNT